MSGKKPHSRSVTTSRSGGQASTVAVFLAAAGVLGWFWWKKRKAGAEKQPKGSTKGRGSTSGRSGFRFPGTKKSSNNNSNIISSSRQVAQQPFILPPGPAAAKVAGGSRKGNPKKANKKQRREEKAVRKETKGKGLELIHNANIQTKEEEEGPTTVKYVDMAKTSDIYDRVREYQETGKKRY